MTGVQFLFLRSQEQGFEGRTWISMQPLFPGDQTSLSRGPSRPIAGCPWTMPPRGFDPCCSLGRSE